MGICEKQFNFVQQYGLNNSNGKKMLELGDQILNPFLSKKMNNYSTGKQLYKSLSYDHTSFDLNGKNGSIKVDLTKINTQYNNNYDIITDHGTIEHVEDQYMCFKNIHDWGKIGCVYIHCVPLEGEEHKKYLGYEFPPHGYYAYSTQFWNELCKLCNYKIIKNQGNLVHNLAIKFPKNYYSSSCYSKVSNNKFITKEQFYKLFDKYNQNTKHKLTKEYHKQWKKNVNQILNT